MSFHASLITGRPGLRARAGQTLVLFGSALIVAIVLAIPGQRGWVLGTQLTALGAITGAALALVERGKIDQVHDDPGRLNRLLDRISPNTLTSVTIAIAGITKLIGAGGGLYWLVPAVILALVGGMINTWLLLTRLA